MIIIFGEPCAILLQKNNLFQPYLEPKCCISGHQTIPVERAD